MAKCRDCKYLDLKRRTCVGYVCTNKDRITRKGTLGYLKLKNTPACKSGFEPREVAENE